ncbi:MAG: TIGR02594 family protein, partial [Hyphomicrobiaceae bacterium]|nr:TIGR02594 family protein [Hyphomicrobiaceae bacterium]
PSSGHVAFLLGETGTDVILLGGNQSNRVTIAAYPKSRLLGLRWPAERDTAERNPVAAAPVDFDWALEHVLEMEGGYSNDPHDPGGPTDKGVTLAVFARHLGRSLGDHNRAALIDDLKRISEATVRDIYFKRYWSPSRASQLPAAVGLIHFDAAVNHGLRGAAELLQAAVRVDVDGEIGPITLAAAIASDPAETVTRYADLRRARYRALPHFWRFGRGWLNRVDKTERRAHAAADHVAVSAAPDQPAKGPDMTTSQPKFWGQSVTIWGAVITALSTVVPVLGPAMGVDLTPDLVKQAGEQLVSVVQALGGLIGTAMTIYGRARANGVLTADRPL